jgi:DNA polymerase III epsilon subunit-like protein|tara:strand:+ start:1863 stop:2552 length:690 start_codon:yes stop_codon:yes gene_type:complete
MNYRDIIVFDFETGSRNPLKTQPTQIAAIALHGRKLTLQPGGVFNSEIRPILDDEKATKAGVDPLEDEALQITGKTRAALAKAPLPKTVWKKFAEFCNKYNFRKTSYTAPIAAGYNIVGFDLPIVQRMCEAHGPTDGNGRQKIFNPIFKIDLMDMIFSWTENNKDVKSLSMDYMREYMGFPQESKDNAHDALQDVKDTANILIKFLKFQRKISEKTKFEKAFADGEFYV